MIRFYLRKLEGADVLLAYESNFFRQELHRLYPTAPDAPPILENSLSTRKPRPTKQQKLMAQHGVENPDDLPQHLRTKPYNVKRRHVQDDPKTDRTPSQSSGTSGTAMSKRGNYRDHTPTTLNFRPPLTANAFPTKSHHHPSQTPQLSAPFTVSASATALPTFDSPLNFGVGPVNSPPPNMDPSLFTSSLGGATFIDDRPRHESTYHDHVHRPDHNHDHSDMFGHSGSSQHSANFDTLLADLTNLDDGPEGGGPEDHEEAEHLDPALLTSVERR